MEAQRFPEDYDGIIGGSPANNWTRLYAGGHLWYSIATLKDPESYIPAAKIALLGNAVTAACDAIDGIVDGVLDDPRKCQFDPAVLTCKQGQDPATLLYAKAGEGNHGRLDRCAQFARRACAPSARARRRDWRRRLGGLDHRPAHRSPACTGWPLTASSGTWCSTTWTTTRSTSTLTPTWISHSRGSARPWTRSIRICGRSSSAAVSSFCTMAGATPTSRRSTPSTTTKA